jgi:hypothetical protein
MGMRVAAKRATKTKTKPKTPASFCPLIEKGKAIKRKVHPSWGSVFTPVMSREVRKRREKNGYER